MLTDHQIKKIAWQCRRGMLELDLILEPFAQKHLRQLSSDEQLLFVRLLSHEDQDLFAWLLNINKPADKEIKKIIDIIRNEL